MNIRMLIFFAAFAFLVSTINMERIVKRWVQGERG